MAQKGDFMGRTSFAITSKVKVSPMLTKLVDKPFDKKGWIFEIKWDGYRAIAFKDKDVQLVSRGRQSFNRLFPSIIAELKKIRGDFIIDGEIAILDKKGISQFQLLQNYQRKKEGTPYYYVFDILSYRKRDLAKHPLIERKSILKKLLQETPGLSHIKYSDHINEKGIAFFNKAKKLGLEGIIAKKADSTYQFRRSSDWVKIKSTLRQEVVIGGFTEPKGGRKKFGALLVGVYEKGNLVYTGHVGGGFNEQLLEDVYQKLQKLISKTCPFFQRPRTNTPATWVKPKLVCEVAFREWTNDGNMRMPIFKGLRTDKPAKEVIRER